MKHSGTFELIHADLYRHTQHERNFSQFHILTLNRFYRTAYRGLAFSFNGIGALGCMLKTIAPSRTQPITARATVLPLWGILCGKRQNRLSQGAGALAICPACRDHLRLSGQGTSVCACQRQVFDLPPAGSNKERRDDFHGQQYLIFDIFILCGPSKP